MGAVKLYWYMLEIFTEHDLQKEGFVKMDNFSSMMHEFLSTPVKHGLKTPSKDEYDTLFKKYDPRNDGRLTVDEWMSLAKEEVYKILVINCISVDAINMTKIYVDVAS